MIEQLRFEITNNLPGEQAHLPLSPLNRPLSSLALKNAATYRESAVAVVIFKSQNENHIILIQRPEYNGKHSGQISFPGGKKELHENDLFDTAVRECFEEIGLKLDPNIYCGRLTPVYIPVSQFYVDSHVFYLENKPELTKDEKEVKSIFSIKARDLLADSNLRRKDIITEQSIILRDVPHFYIEEKVIWGATALILNELKFILSKF